jgi:hypothetical protein
VRPAAGLAPHARPRCRFHHLAVLRLPLQRILPRPARGEALHRVVGKRDWAARCTGTAHRLSARAPAAARGFPLRLFLGGDFRAAAPSSRANTA